MKAVACIIQCQCGGHIEVLNEDGIYYVLTDAKTIIFQGRCGSCFEGVRVEKPILELMLYCPIEGKAN